MSRRDTFRGYGPEQGYPFLREAVAAHDYAGAGVPPSSRTRSSSRTGLSATAATSRRSSPPTRASPSPTPYIRSTSTRTSWPGAPAPSVDGRYEGILYLDSTPANGYVPAVPAAPADLVYLCFPNNPTGAVATRAQLAAWVDYARRNRAVILFDSAYEAYIRDPQIPHSIYEIEGARDVAIEFRSFSKTAGFTGTALRVHGGAEDADGLGRGRAAPRAPRPLEPPAHHQVQRRLLSRPEGRGRGLHGRGPEPGARAHGLLPGERQADPRRDGPARLPVRRGRERAVHLGQRRPGTRGSSSTFCWRGPRSSARRAPVSAGAARATSGSAPSTAGRTSSGRWSGSPPRSGRP